MVKGGTNVIFWYNCICICSLESQLIGGLKEGPGAHLKCRHCMGNSNDIKTMIIKPVAHFAKYSL